MDILKIKSGDHLLVRVKAKYDFNKDDNYVFVEIGCQTARIEKDAIVSHEPAFVVGEKVLGTFTPQVGEIIKLDGNSAAAIVWEDKHLSWCDVKELSRLESGDD